ncbi:hypothetical protein COT97_05135 [Candidatus Falkowbacteria bacterium CG10_big_fil_rev_8_21_14_0_10_39_11]|uniref:Uncharacterized protein n=1 Tax=Candidatus Falkowbacteria bacterium CG10_big_fil_rev_8_21_14_0_10_39_11 TaxID=1974565 RepID=A0A2H0V3Q0_9BACT|nr:MAG: hypothetical protein COT97_05135 [Candidatus Falkowbacteria bacterium CG10_big_fil_rev_8_21_14_0_10_39_11]
MNTEFEATTDFANIYNKLLDYLSRQDHSEAKLVEKVTNLKKYYSKTRRYDNYTRENVEYVIEILKKKGILNEVRNLERMLELSLDQVYGIRRIEQKMYTRKYKKENIKKVLTEHRRSEYNFNYEKIEALVNKKRSDLKKKYEGDKEKLYQIKTKLYAFLAQKGFEGEEIKLILNKIYE